MNWADWAIVLIFVVSCLISIKRGFVKEAISLLIWALAFFVAVSFHQPLASLLADFIFSPSARQMLAYGALFAATLVVGSMVNYLVGELVHMTGLSGTDRLFGMVFGMARALIVVMALLILTPMIIPVNQESWWRESQLIPQFSLMEQWCRDSFGQLMGLAGRFI
jgi:membrane protein required for colicin V production